MVRRGNTEKLKIQIEDKECNPIDIETIEMAEFTFISNGEIMQKTYGEEESEVTYDDSTKSFIIELSQEEMFDMNSTVEIQTRIKTLDGEVKGTEIETHYVADVLSNEVL